MHMILPILLPAFNFRLDLIVLGLLTVNSDLDRTRFDILIFDNFVVFALLWLVLCWTYAITLWEDRYKQMKEKSQKEDYLIEFLTVVH